MCANLEHLEKTAWQSNFAACSCKGTKLYCGEQVYTEPQRGTCAIRVLLF